MRRAEGVVHVHVAQRGQLFRKLGVVLLFLRMETQVFEQQHFAGRRQHRLHCRSDAVRRHRHGLCQQLRQTRRDRPQAHFRIRLSFGTAEVARQDHAGALFERVSEWWK